MSELEQLFSTSPQSAVSPIDKSAENSMADEAQETEMTEKLPTYDKVVDDDNDSVLQTPEPDDDTKNDRTEVIYDDNIEDNNNNNNNNENNNKKQMDNLISPKSDNEFDNDEEKDSLYDVLAPKQPVSEQIEEVVNSVPDQNKIIVINDGNQEEEEEEEVMHNQPLAYDPKKSMDYDSEHYNLKSTLKKNQRAWVDPWEAAVQDTFYHKEIKDLRPTFEIVNSTIRGADTLKNLFEQSPQAIPEDNHYDENPDDIELEEEEKAMAEQPKRTSFFFILAQLIYIYIIYLNRGKEIWTMGWCDGRMFIKYIWCYNVFTCRVCCWSSWNYSSINNYEYICMCYSFNCIINVCNMYKWYYFSRWCILYYITCIGTKYWWSNWYII